MLCGVSPREDPNEGPYPRVRESIEPVPGGSIDPVFGLALVSSESCFLRPGRGSLPVPSSASLRHGLKVVPLTRIGNKRKRGT